MTTLTRRNLLSTAAGLIATTETACNTTRANSAVSFGVIGLGRRGSYVGAHMANSPNARLAGICDIYEDRIEEARDAIPGAKSVRAFKDLHEMLARPEIDAVLIATPVFLHPEHFEAAVKAKKHIYCEKPCAASVRGCRRVMRASQAADPSLNITFGFQQRYGQVYLKAKALV